MQVPLEITFREVERSPAIEKFISEEVARLEKNRNNSIDRS